MITTPKMLGLLVVAFVAGSFVASPELRAYAAATIGSADIIDNSIQSAEIKDAEVKTADLAGNAVTAAKIEDGEVKTAEIRDGTIKAADVSPGFISYGFKAPGQDGFFPCGTCYQTITNVPGAVEGAKVFVMLNFLPGQGKFGSCAVNDVISDGFVLSCVDVSNDAYLDYVVINPY